MRSGSIWRLFLVYLAAQRRMLFQEMHNLQPLGEVVTVFSKKNKYLRSCLYRYLCIYVNTSACIFK